MPIVRFDLKEVHPFLSAEESIFSFFFSPDNLLGHPSPLPPPPQQGLRFLLWGGDNLFPSHPVSMRGTWPPPFFSFFGDFARVVCGFPLPPPFALCENGQFVSRLVPSPWCFFSRSLRWDPRRSFHILLLFFSLLQR